MTTVRPTRPPRSSTDSERPDRRAGSGTHPVDTRFRIVLLGDSGVGKTTAAHIAAREAGIPLWVADPKLTGQQSATGLRRRLRQLEHVARFPQLFRLGLRAAAETEDHEFRHIAANIANVATGLVKTGYGLVDEVPRHRLGSCFANRSDSEIARWVPLFAASLPQVDAAIWVRCDPKVAWSRYLARIDPGSDRAGSRARIERRYARYEATIGLIADMPMRVIDSTDATPDEVATELVRAVRSLRGQPFTGVPGTAPVPR